MKTKVNKTYIAAIVFSVFLITSSFVSPLYINTTYPVLTQAVVKGSKAIKYTWFGFTAKQNVNVYGYKYNNRIYNQPYHVEKKITSEELRLTKLLPKGTQKTVRVNPDNPENIAKQQLVSPTDIVLFATGNIFLVLSIKYKKEFFNKTSSK